jgi:DNA-binding transcriptional ArsR family regulator
VIRLRLDAADLAKVRVRPSGGPFAEALFSLNLLRRRHPHPFAAGWMRAIRTRLAARPDPLLMAVTLGPDVDLHAVVQRALSVAEALELLRAQPMTATPAPAGDVDQRFLSYYRNAIDPYWRRIRSHLETERSRCGRAMSEGGVDHLLATLHPRVRWRAPVLEVDTRTERRAPDRHPALAARANGTNGANSHEAHDLLGRSLVCVPSVFAMDAPRVLLDPRDPTLPGLLVYPALRRIEDATSLWTPRAAPGPSALARLLGQTQAAALIAIAETCTTTELARRVGVAAPTASHHTSILRGAGLIASRRTGNTVVHELTSLGADLIGLHR